MFRFLGCTPLIFKRSIFICINKTYENEYIYIFYLCTCFTLSYNIIYETNKHLTTL